MDQFLLNPSSLDDGLPLYSSPVVVNSDLTSGPAETQVPSTGNVDLYSLLFEGEGLQNSQSEIPLGASSDSIAIIDLEPPFPSLSELPNHDFGTIETTPSPPPFSVSSPISYQGTPSPSFVDSNHGSPSSDYNVNINAGEDGVAITPKTSDDENGAQKKKKRRRYELKGNTAVSLTREQLLTLSSKDLEEYMKTLGQQRSLTPEENKELKHQLRIIKNRFVVFSAFYRCSVSYELRCFCSEMQRVRTTVTYEEEGKS